jgi:alkylhydroperoxidase family enzyme
MRACLRRSAATAPALLVAILAGSVAFAEGSRTRLSAPRLAPLQESDWTEEQSALLAPLAERGRLYNIQRTLARHPPLMKAWGPFGRYILTQSTLPPRHRELVTLRIGWLCHAEYEFGQHTRIGRQVGLSDEEILRITRGPDAPGWTDFERVLLRAVDELHVDAFVLDATWEALAAEYREEQLMDLVFTVAEYNMISMVLNTFGVQRDPGIPGFPEGAVAGAGR